jgi:hypothetical protein
LWKITPRELPSPAGSDQKAVVSEQWSAPNDHNATP